MKGFVCLLAILACISCKHVLKGGCDEKMKIIAEGVYMENTASSPVVIQIPKEGKNFRLVIANKSFCWISNFSFQDKHFDIDNVGCVEGEGYSFKVDDKKEPASVLCNVASNTQQQRRQFNIKLQSCNCFANVIIMQAGCKDSVCPQPSKDTKHILLKDKEERVYDVVEYMPKYPGGTDSLKKYISQNMRYPQKAKEKGTEGMVVVGFVVEKDGSVTDIKVTKHVAPSLDKEALRIIRSVPCRWIPGMQNGTACRVRYHVPVSFILQ